VATERQIAANRRNARKSTGPRSSAGKRRARGNAYRHGLSATRAQNAKRINFVKKLVRRIVGKSSDRVLLEHARTLAEAEYDLTRIRALKNGIIDRVLGSVERETSPDSTATATFPRSAASAPMTSAGTSQPSGQTVERTLADLRRLDRYERHASALRARSARALSDRKINNNNF
jgi:hypothetical protein